MCIGATATVPLTAVNLPMREPKSLSVSYRPLLSNKCQLDLAVEIADLRV